IRGAFDDIARLCQAKGTLCIVVNMPPQAAAYDYISPLDELAYLETLQTLINEGNLTLWAFNTRAWRSFLAGDSFLSLPHLTEIGARKFTGAMAALYARNVLQKTVPPGSGDDCAQVSIP